MSMLQADFRQDVLKLVEVTYNHAINAAKIYRTNHVVMMYGDDFAHPMADISYEAMDSIIRRMKDKHPEVEVRYSTMQAYFDEVKKANMAWPVYKSDLLPTFTDMSEYWSGFYTTDPAFKRRVHDYTEMTRSVASLDAFQKFHALSNHTA